MLTVTAWEGVKRRTLQHLLQGFAAMPVVQQVKSTALLATGQLFMNVHQIVRRTGGLHALGEPGLVR
jgi:hypothetical protein